MAACRCPERQRPAVLPDGSNDRPRQWFVLTRNSSHSAFNGYKFRWSKTSYLCCRACGAHWDTEMDVSDFKSSEFFPAQSEPSVEPYDVWLQS